MPAQNYPSKKYTSTKTIHLDDDRDEESERRILRKTDSTEEGRDQMGNLIKRTKSAEEQWRETLKDDPNLRVENIAGAIYVRELDREDMSEFQVAGGEKASSSSSSSASVTLSRRAGSGGKISKISVEDGESLGEVFCTLLDDCVDVLIWCCPCHKLLLQAVFGMDSTFVMDADMLRLKGPSSGKNVTRRSPSLKRFTKKLLSLLCFSLLITFLSVEVYSYYSQELVLTQSFNVDSSLLIPSASSSKSTLSALESKIRVQFNITMCNVACSDVDFHYDDKMNSHTPDIASEIFKRRILR